MPDYSAIVRSLDLDKFSEVMAASPRKAREVYFHRHDIKAPKSTSRLVKPGAKSEIRTARLYECLQSTPDEQLCEEMLRTWLLNQRAMLAAALDHLQIPHTNGLTESDDVAKIEKLSVSDLRKLAKALEGVAARDEIAIYLKFMGASDVEKALAS